MSRASAPLELEPERWYVRLRHVSRGLEGYKFALGDTPRAAQAAAERLSCHVFPQSYLYAELPRPCPPVLLPTCSAAQ